MLIAHRAVASGGGWKSSPGRDFRQTKGNRDGALSMPVRSGLRGNSYLLYVLQSLVPSGAYVPRADGGIGCSPSSP